MASKRRSREDLPMNDNARLVRELYVREVRKFLWQRGDVSDYGSQPIPQWDGGKDAYGRTHVSLWPHIAKFFVDNELSPELVICCMFREAQLRGAATYPPPSLFIGDLSLAIYKRHRLQIITEKAAEYFSDQERLRTWIWQYKLHYKMDDADAMRHALSANRSDLSPLFRYCMARKNGLTDVAEKFKSRALLEYVWNKDLLEEWSEILPSDIQQDAERVKAELCEGVTNGKRR